MTDRLVVGILCAVPSLIKHSQDSHRIFILSVKVYNILVLQFSLSKQYSILSTAVMREKDEIDFRNQLLPDKDQTPPKKVGKEEDKPLFSPQMMEDLQMLLAVFLIILLTFLIIILKVDVGSYYT